MSFLHDLRAENRSPTRCGAKRRPCGNGDLRFRRLRRNPRNAPELEDRIE